MYKRRPSDLGGLPNCVIKSSLVGPKNRAGGTEGQALLQSISKEYPRKERRARCVHDRFLLAGRRIWNVGGKERGYPEEKSTSA